MRFLCVLLTQVCSFNLRSKCSGLHPAHSIFKISTVSFMKTQSCFMNGFLRDIQETFSVEADLFDLDFIRFQAESGRMILNILVAMHAKSCLSLVTYIITLGFKHKLGRSHGGSVRYFQFNVHNYGNRKLTTPLNRSVDSC